MSETEGFLVSGAELECPNGTITCKLKADKEQSTTKIGNKAFASVKATKKGENLDGFGMCMSEECIGGTVPCMVRMVTADKWMNPLLANLVLKVQGKEEAICREAKLLCISGRAHIKALTTGQEDPTENEKKFRQYMSEMFGFDDDIIDIMLKVIYAIDEEYPNESERKKAWRFASLMGRFSYGYGAEDKFIDIRHELKPSEFPDSGNADKIVFDKFLWDVTVGGYEDINSKMSEKDYFVNKLNLSEYEYYKLRFHVMAQHEITSRPATSYPDFMLSKIIYIEKGEDGSVKKDEYKHPYFYVWEDYFLKYDPDGDFSKEWNSLYDRYVNISEDNKKSLPNQKTKYEKWIFSDYGNIESTVKDYPIEPNYSDFAHQQILTATITLEDAAADKMIGNYLGYYATYKELKLGIAPTIKTFPEQNDLIYRWDEIGEGATHILRTSFAGWLGDIRLADSKMSEDDYKADLDGLNVSGIIIRENINTIEAINEYYCALESGETTREKEFLCNMGGGDASKGYKNITTVDNIASAKSLIWGEKAEADEASKKFMEKIAVGLE